MDEIDEQILAELARDGRVSHHELAAKVSLSRAAVSRRLGALLSGSGVRVVGLVHPSVLGEHVMAHIAIDTSESAEAVAKQVAAVHCVPFVSLTVGAMAMTAEIRAKTQEEFFEAVADIRRLPGVFGASVSLYDKLLVDVLPEAPTAAYSPDAVDLSLIASLRQDGRTSYSALAAAAGVSIGTARSRTLKLLTAGVVRIGVIGDAEPAGGQLRLGLGLRVKGTSHHLAEELAALPEISFLATAAGQFDLVATLASASIAAAMSALDTVRTHPDVSHSETWAHVQVLKEQH